MSNGQLRELRERTLLTITASSVNRISLPFAMASSLLPTLLVICALHPAEGGIDLLLSNAGTTEVNGVWRHQGENNRQILQTKCPICTLICTSHEPIGYFNDRHEFKHVESNYEMFFFKSQDSQDSWYTNPSDHGTMNLLRLGGIFKKLWSRMEGKCTGMCCMVSRRTPRTWLCL